MEDRSAPPPAGTLAILAADLLATHAGNLLAQLAYAGDWEPATKLKDALQTYSEVRLGTTMAEGADAVLRAIEEKDPQKVNVNDWPPAPETERSVRT